MRECRRNYSAYVRSRLFPIFGYNYAYEPVSFVVAKMRSRRLLRDSGGVVCLVRSGAGKRPRPGGIPVRRFACGYAGRHPSFGKHRPFGVTRNSRNYPLAVDCLAGRFGASAVIGLARSQAKRRERKRFLVRLSDPDEFGGMRYSSEVSGRGRLEGWHYCGCWSGISSATFCGTSPLDGFAVEVLT